MKKIVFALFMGLMLNTLTTNAQEVNWISLEEAIKKCEKEPRKILIDFYTVWCGPCKMMTKNTFGNPMIADYVNKNFYAVKFNAEGNETLDFMGQKYSNPSWDPARENTRNAQHQLAQAFQITAYPTIVYMDEKYQVLQAMPGYYTPEQIDPILHFIATNAYKDTKWDAYQATFKKRM